MKVTEIAFVGYPVTDLKRARSFYEDTLGLKVSHTFGDEKSAWIEYDIGPGTLAITNMAPDWKASPGGGCAGLEVDDFPASIKRLKDKHVTFTFEPMETPVCHMAGVSDPDGNSITIHKRK
ncbi:MAG TPA: VOC family protein [Verrucomicrobiae bacterium]|nr:VOC family protein [Verrucomicrobiae bacterium]